MKKLVTFILLIATGCSSQRVFIPVVPGNEPAAPVARITVKPEDYTLYLRQVCLKNDQLPYVDCPADMSGMKKLEIEYLFISKNNDRVIYITNFPDKYENIYGKGGFEMPLPEEAPAPFNVNSFYFSKIFIGTIDRTAKTITFIREANDTIVISFTILPAKQIVFTALTEQTKKKPVTRQTNGALDPVPMFVPQPSFKWMFSRYDRSETTMEPAVGVKDNAIIIKKDDGVYFEMTAIWNGYPGTWIKYKYNRLATKIF